MGNINRKKEITNICLDTFIKNGLSETTVRDLSTALKLQSGGIYYWFEDKDDAVVACAEEAALRLEDNLIIPAIKDINDPDQMMKRLKEHADKMRQTMKFFVSVCALDKYEDRMRPALNRLTDRYEKYAQRFSEILNCDFDEVSPYVYLTITTVSDYMIFGETKYIMPQIELIKKALKGFLNNNNEERAK
ncbi:MAG: TetR/AcrR family transcriptional regulator [Eubacteriales bacterium]|nr:TetR/AcrR family transcriptional regulator [Eubacteriales bacterium]